MSILDTIYLLFKADTSDLKKGSEEATNITKNLNKTLKDTDTISGQLGQKFLEIARPLTGIAAGFLSINALISGFKNTLDYDIDLGKTSRALGVNAEQLDIWDNAIRHAGGTAEGFQSSLRNLSEHFNTNPSVALKFLPQLADVFSKISRFSAFKLGKSLGLDEATILLLQQGRREVESVLKQQKELGAVTKQDIEITTKYNQSTIDLSHSFRTLANSIINPLLPGLTKFFEMLTKGFLYLTQHKDVIIGSLIGIASALGVIFAETILITGGVLLLIALIGLWYEDYQTYLKKGKSVTEEYLKSWNKLDDTINNTIDVWINKITKFLDKFKILKGLSDDIKSAREATKQEDHGFQPRNLFEFLLNYKLNKSYLGSGQNLLSAASSSPINNSPSSIVNSSLFKRDNNIHIAEINMEIQSNDAQGVAYGLRAEIQKVFAIHADQAQGNFSNNVGY